jgi:hypothetical protein
MLTVTHISGVMSQRTGGGRRAALRQRRIIGDDAFSQNASPVAFGGYSDVGRLLYVANIVLTRYASRSEVAWRPGWDRRTPERGGIGVAGRRGQRVAATTLGE